jgi:hypothetical protein
MNQPASTISRNDSIMDSSTIKPALPTPNSHTSRQGPLHSKKGPQASTPVSQHFITLMARGSPSLHEAADMLSAIRALEDELAQLRRHAQEIKIAAVQAFEKDINHIMTAYKETLDLLGDEHARRWVSERAPEELRKLDEVMRCVESMEGGFAEAE